MPAVGREPRVEAQHLLEEMFKAGAKHTYLAEGMRKEAAMRSVLSASGEVTAHMVS